MDFQVASSRPRIPFDPDKDRFFCGACGAQLVKGGHITTEYMLCPNHGEFTLAPIISRVPLEIMQMTPPFDIVPNKDPDAGKWFLEAPSDTWAAMWQTCKYLDQQRAGRQPAPPAPPAPPASPASPTDG